MSIFKRHIIVQEIQIKDILGNEKKESSVRKTKGTVFLELRGIKGKNRTPAERELSRKEKKLIQLLSEKSNGK